MKTGSQLAFDFGITPEQACILCHLSSECTGCCLKCIKVNNGGSCQGQNCSQHDLLSQTKRWDTWMTLVANTLPELKRFIPRKYRPLLKKYTKVRGRY